MKRSGMRSSISQSMSSSFGGIILKTDHMGALRKGWIFHTGFSVWILSGLYLGLLWIHMCKKVRALFHNGISQSYIIEYLLSLQFNIVT